MKIRQEHSALALVSTFFGSFKPFEVNLGCANIKSCENHLDFPFPKCHDFLRSAGIFSVSNIWYNLLLVL